MQLVSNRKIIFPYRTFHFAVVGAGGNGSYLVRDLARIVSINNHQYDRNDKIILIDADEVEEKNLARQNFIAKDIGKNKAEVLAKRYSKAYGVEISYADEYISETNAKDIIFGNPRMGADYSIVLIGCVDNNKTRHILHNVYRKTLPNNSIYIDVGNEEYGGQAVFSWRRAMSLKGIWIQTGSYRSSYSTGAKVNDIVEEFELDDNDKHPEELSCAEHAMSAPQNIGTNIMASQIIFNFCNAMLAGAVNFYRPDREEIIAEENNHRDGVRKLIKLAPMIGNHIVYFNSKTGKIDTKPFSSEIQDFLKNFD